MSLEEIRELFHSDDVTRINEAVEWLLSSNDTEMYSACLKGWKTSENGEKVQLKFDSSLLDGEEAMIKEDQWRNGHGSFAVIRLLAQPLEGASYDSSLDLSLLTEVGLQGVQFTVLPPALAHCTALRKLKLDGCEAIEYLDDVRLVHCLIRHDSDWVTQAIDKITIEYAEVAACFQAELDSLPRPFDGETGQSASHAERLMSIRKWKENNRTLPNLVRGLTIFQVKEQEEQPNEATKLILDYLSENSAKMVLDSIPDVAVDQVQVAAIVEHLIYGLKQNSDVSRSNCIHLRGDVNQWYFSFLARVSEVNSFWCLALLYELPITAAISVWGGEVWCPKIMYNGSVVIRNHHRVIVPDYVGTVFLDEAEVQTFLGQLDQFSQDWLMAVGTVGGEVTLHEKPSGIRNEAIRNGNNFITILEDAETMGTLHPAIQSWIGFVFENTRSGMMLRLVPGGVSFYRTFRGSDDFDYALEYFDWIQFNEGQIDKEMPMGRKVDESPWSFSGVSWEQESEMQDKFLYTVLQESFQYDLMDGFNSPELEQNNPFGISNMDVLYSEFAAFMKKDALDNSPWTQKIFSKNATHPMGYEVLGDKKLNFLAANGFNAIFNFAASYQTSDHSLELLPDIIGLIVTRLESKLYELNFKRASLSASESEQSRPMNPWGEITVFNENNTIVVMTFPYDCHVHRRAEIDRHFGARVLDINMEEEEFTELSVRLNINLDDSGTTIDSIDVEFLKGMFEDYVDSYCEGDWSCFSDGFMNFIQIYTSIPNGLLFEVEELGKAFTSIENYDWPAEDTSGLIAPYLKVWLPDAGVSQGFDSGDLDSGNM